MSISSLILLIAEYKGKIEFLAIYFLLSFFIIIMFFLAYIKLELEINELGIKYRYFPFIGKFRFHSWSEIQSLSLVEISPIVDFDIH
jgi:hypothetical protein